MFQSSRGTRREPQVPTEADQILFERAVNAIHHMPMVSTSLTSIVDEIENVLKSDLSDNRAACGLSDILSGNARHRDTMEAHFLRLVIATLKEKWTRRGTRQAVLKEELEAMLKVNNPYLWGDVRGVLDRAGNATE